VFKLVLSLRDLTKKECTLRNGDVITIGPNSENDIIIDNPTSCLRQAYVAQMGDELILWSIENGNTVVLNGRAVRSAKLRNGDVVQFGSCHRLTVSEKESP
jgi:ribosome-associated protein YbcJ (S4-like RNA binding protein)